MHKELPNDKQLTTFKDQKKQVEVGNPIPPGMRTMDLPPEVTEEFPEFRSYRYLLSGDNVALVDRDQLKVVAFVDLQESPR